MTGTDSAAVVAGYDQRAAFASAEAQHTPVPDALPGLLTTSRRVAELPCAAGHYLEAYAAAGCQLTLVDANRDMLAAATSRAALIGIADGQYTAIAAYVQGLPPLDVDLLVLPNAAVNQLGCQLDLSPLFCHLVQAVPAGTRLLAPILCTRGGSTDASAIYDPHAEHGQWFTDRTFTPPAGGALRRLRRQHRTTDTVRLDFDYRTVNDTTAGSATVTLRLFSPAEILAACQVAGLCNARLSVGNRLTELIATTGGHR